MTFAFAEAVAVLERMFVASADEEHDDLPDDFLALRVADRIAP